MKIFEYFINLDERGEFFADIRNDQGETILEIDTDYAQFLTEERVNLKSLWSVSSYFKLLGDIPKEAILKAGNKL